MTEASYEYYSTIEVGKQYADEITNVIGTATQLCINLDGTQQAFIEWGAGGERKSAWIDTDRLSPV